MDLWCLSLTFGLPWPLKLVWKHFGRPRTGRVLMKYLSSRAFLIDQSMSTSREVVIHL